MNITEYSKNSYNYKSNLLKINSTILDIGIKKAAFQQLSSWFYKALNKLY
jgi:hypothetical protein